MGQRIAFGAIAVLFAANVATQTRSPAFVALAGIYVATSGSGEGAVRYVLTLSGDGSAALASEFSDVRRMAAPETGIWILDGATVQVALVGSGNRGALGLTLDVKDGALIAGSDESASRFAGLTFTKSSPNVPAPAER